MTPFASVFNPDRSELFEVSGKFISSRHSAVEEVETDHQDICLALQSRLEVSINIYIIDIQ